VNGQQKLILGLLAAIAIVVLAGLSYMALSLLSPRPVQPVAALPATTAPAPPTPSPLLTAPPVTGTPTATALPTPTSTRVITVTVEPTPEPTRINCINNVTDFEASGLITNEQVQVYLRETLPLSHLDNCRIIRYIPQLVEVYSTPAAGKFIPLFRHISVYAVPSELYSQAELLETLIHEVGHNAYFNIRLENKELAKQWDELHRQSHVTFAGEGLGFVSEYARTDELEDFAESYAAYIRNPAGLKLASPQKYDFMRQTVFAGREYAP
jgi:hypothetical protein